MTFSQTRVLAEKPLFLLSLLLCVFFAKGVIFSVLLPFFQGPDEQIHYGTIQYRAEPTDKNWVINKEKDRAIGADITTYHLSEESIQSAVATQFDEVKFQGENTQEFSQSAIGIHEGEIITNSWKRSIDIYPTNTSGAQSFYYTLGVQIERLFSDQSIFFRLFALRIFSVILGTLVVLLAYLTAKKVGFSEWHSLIVASLVAFQPMFSASASQVNIDIALILSFSLFIYTAVALLKDGWQWQWILFLLFSIILGVFSKGPGIVLAVSAVPLILFVLYQKYSHIPRKHLFWGLFLGCSLLIGIAFVATPSSYLISVTNFSATSQFSSPRESIGRYLDKTTNQGALRDTETSYWGNFGWLDTAVSSTTIGIIWAIEIIASLGIILFLISQQSKDYLPEKKYTLFFIGLIIVLELAIRFYDWRVFDATKQILIGTPGRYFLPNIIPHILIMITGLGFFTRDKKQFNTLLKVLFILAILFALYAMINVIIPRYYL